MSNVMALPAARLEVDDSVALERLSPLDHEDYYHRITDYRVFTEAHLGSYRTFTPDTAKNECLRSHNAMVDGRGLTYWATFDDKRAGIVGLSKLYNNDDDPWAMHYWLSPNMRGKGIMRRSAGALADYAFTAVGVPAIELIILKDNFKSQAVAEAIGGLILPATARTSYDEWIITPDAHNSSRQR